MNDIKDCFGQSSIVDMPTTELTIRSLAKKNSDYAVFSTPGHKGELSRTDLTEYDGGRIFPQDSIERAEQRVAKRYGAKYAKFSVCGSSMAIKAAIVAVDSDIIAPVLTHRAVEEGATLIKRRVHFFDTGSDGSLPATPIASHYEQAIKNHPECKLAVLTHPDYFGRGANLLKIKEVCQKYGVLLLIDSAHGAHFATRPQVFTAGAEKCADFATVSTHKTLRSLTQTAIGFCNNDEYAERWKKAFELLGTTSPSYELLASIEGGIEYEDKHADYYDTLIEFRKKINDEFGFAVMQNWDYMRLVMCSPDGNGETLFNELVKRKIMPETYFKEYCIMILTLSDKKEKLDALYRAFKEIYNEKR